MLTRRTWLALVPVAVAAFAARPVLAAEPIPVVVPNHAIGALVEAVGRDLVSLSVGEVGPTEIAVAGGPAIDIAAKIRLKGDGDAQTRFLDDPRNAGRVGAHIRDAIASAHPELAERLKSQHRSWSRGLALKVLRWTKTLQSCPSAGRRIKDDHGRVYLLEWAGAEVDPGGATGPDLAGLPPGPSDSTAAAYETYVEALVASMS